MMPSPFWIPQPRTLAIDPTPRGFAFAVLEGPEKLIDWGLARVWATSDREWLARVDAVIDRFQPAVLALEATDTSRLGERARTRLCNLSELAEARRAVQVAHVRRADIRQQFGGPTATKRGIAVAITRLFPELADKLPPRRRPWMSEDERMNIFDAVSFALVTATNGL